MSQQDTTAQEEDIRIELGRYDTIEVDKQTLEVTRDRDIYNSLGVKSAVEYGDYDDLEQTDSRVILSNEKKKLIIFLDTYEYVRRVDTRAG
jgi:hypothetical protein